MMIIVAGSGTGAPKSNRRALRAAARAGRRLTARAAALAAAAGVEAVALLAALPIPSFALSTRGFSRLPRIPNRGAPCSFSAPALLRAAASPRQDGEEIKDAEGASRATATATAATSKMREDIESMRQEAAQRLHKLEDRMRELQRQQHDLKEHELHQVRHDRIAQHQESQQQARARVAEEKGGGREERAAPTPPAREETAAAAPPAATSSSSSSTILGASSSSPPPRGRHERLDGTRWKLGFNLGREPGTWMPPAWGASGSRLYFEVVVDFLAEPNLDERDDFFLGRAGCKRLRVLDAWMFPTGTGSDSRGRRTIRASEGGTYKVLPGQGPRGTDIVRFCLDIADDGVVHDDVNCPVGRLYGTCGYFAMDDGGAAGVAPGASALKEELASEHRQLASQYEQLKLEDEQDPNLAHKIGRMREMYQLRKRLDSVSQELQRARQAHPDRSELRFSRDRTVALSREGGVCRKVPKGLAVEYHILGRVEVASIKPDDAALEHDEYRDLVEHKLHP